VSAGRERGYRGVNSRGNLIVGVRCAEDLTRGFRCNSARRILIFDTSSVTITKGHDYFMPGALLH